MTRILAIDPGSERSAWLRYEDGRPSCFGIEPNEALIGSLRHGFTGVELVVIEWMTPRGLPTSAQEFETLYWIGRFTEAADPLPVERLARDAVKFHLTGQRAKVGDPHVRAALIDRFGGIRGREAAIGTKRSPGPLHGIHDDVWAALALAVVFDERRNAA